ncbi:hypothetical protein A2U01_0103610, partial [Trifolium medium]|nr:hypothetical protein [Trifolium medium]
MTEDPEVVPYLV